MDIFWSLCLRDCNQVFDFLNHFRPLKPLCQHLFQMFRSFSIPYEGIDIFPVTHTKFSKTADLLLGFVLLRSGRNISLPPKRFLTEWIDRFQVAHVDDNKHWRRHISATGLSVRNHKMSIMNNVMDSSIHSRCAIYANLLQRIALLPLDLRPVFASEQNDMRFGYLVKVFDVSPFKIILIQHYLPN